MHQQLHRKGEYMTNQARTIDGRRRLASQLARDFDAWIKLNNTELFERVKQMLPSCTEATRDECLKFLAMDQVYRMIGE